MTPMVWKVLGTAAAVAAGAAACALVDRGLRRLQDKIEADRAAAADTAEPAAAPAQEDAPRATPEPERPDLGASLAEAELHDLQHLQKAPGVQSAAAPAPAAADAGALSAEAEAQRQHLIAQLPADGAAEAGPNPNPVMAGAAEAPRTPDGKVDASKICSSEDFCNWEDLGCQG